MRRNQASADAAHAEIAEGVVVEEQPVEQQRVLRAADRRRTAAVGDAGADDGRPV